MQAHYSEAARSQDQKEGVPQPLASQGNTNPNRCRRRPANGRYGDGLAAPLGPVPLTHVVAGIEVPTPKRLETDYGVNEELIEEDFLRDISEVKGITIWGVAQGYLDREEAIAILSDTSKTVFAEHANAVKEMKEGVLDRLENHLHKNIADILAPIDVTASDLDHNWQTHFCISGDTLYSERVGLSLLKFNYDELEPEDSLDILQFIAFCGALSHHSLTINQLDNEMLWMYSDVPPAFSEGVGVETEHLEQFLSDLKSDLGMEKAIIDFVDMTDGDMEEWECRYEDFDDDDKERLIVFIESYLKAETLSRKLEPFTGRESLDNYLERIERRDKQDWLTLATRLLVAHAKPFASIYDHVSYSGDADHEFLAPIGMGFAYEDSLFNGYHFMSMKSGDSGGINIEFNAFTLDVLSNFHLAESLLYYAFRQTNSDI